MSRSLSLRKPSRSLSLRKPSRSSSLSKRSNTHAYKIIAHDKKTLNVAKSMVLKTWDNGVHPFSVSLQEEEVIVRNNFTKKLVLKISDVCKVYVGSGSYDDPSFDGKETVGNSVLVEQNGGTVYFIGDQVFKFRLSKEKIKEFVSTVGNSGVAYAYLVTTKNIYFFAHGSPYGKHGRVNVKQFDLEEDLYQQYYFNDIQSSNMDKPILGYKLIEKNH